MYGRIFENVLGYRKRDNKSFDVLTLAPQGLYSDFVVIEQQGQRERPDEVISIILQLIHHK